MTVRKDLSSSSVFAMPSGCPSSCTTCPAKRNTCQHKFSVRRGLQQRLPSDSKFGELSSRRHHVPLSSGSVACSWCPISHGTRVSCTMVCRTASGSHHCLNVVVSGNTAVLLAFCSRSSALLVSSSCCAWYCLHGGTKDHVDITSRGVLALVSSLLMCPLSSRLLRLTRHSWQKPWVKFTLRHSSLLEQ